VVVVTVASQEHAQTKMAVKIKIGIKKMLKMREKRGLQEMEHKLDH